MWAPVILTLIFTSIGILLALVLAWAAWRHRNPPAVDTESQIDSKDFGPVETNRWLRALRVSFLLLIITVLGFHSYWVFWADSNKDSQFNKARRFDARNINRRVARVNIEINLSARRQLGQPDRRLLQRPGGGQPFPRCD